jgi:hypothetical protein
VTLRAFSVAIGDRSQLPWLTSALIRNNVTYLADTFALVQKLATEIKLRSQKVGVPPVAVAGSIADEYNTQTGVRQFVDWFQDQVLLKRLLPNWAIEIDDRAGHKSKLLNATMHDLGIGNIKLATAKQIYEGNKSSFGTKIDSWSQLVDYILTDAGTVHIAALVVKQGMTELSAQLKGRPAEVQEAILVTYYKQGPTYAKRFFDRLRTFPGANLQPGEGCRVFKQRAQFVKALGIAS